MLFVNLIEGREFRFRDDPTIYVKVGPNHYRKASAGIHACCLLAKIVPVSDATEAKNEAARRKAARDLRDRINDLEHEEIDAVAEALETIQARRR